MVVEQKFLSQKKEEEKKRWYLHFLTNKVGTQKQRQEVLPDSSFDEKGWGEREGGVVVSTLLFFTSVSHPRKKKQYSRTRSSVNPAFKKQLKRLFHNFVWTKVGIPDKCEKKTLLAPDSSLPLGRV